MFGEIDPSAAREHLHVANCATVRLQAHARWMSGYLVIFATAFAGITLVLGLVQPLALRMMVFVLCWPALMVLAARWVDRRPAKPRRTDARATKYWVATSLLYGAALLWGTPRLIGDASYWIPASIVVATPLLIGAVRVRSA